MTGQREQTSHRSWRLQLSYSLSLNLLVLARREREAQTANALTWCITESEPLPGPCLELGGDIGKTPLHGASASPIPSQGLALSLWGACYSEGHREGSSTVQLRKLKPKEGRGLALELL